MNFVRLKFGQAKSVHHFQKCFASTNIALTKLDTRSLIRVNGEEAAPFLQGMITNDINHMLRGKSSMFAMFLNTTGRVLYDAIVYRKVTNLNEFLLECDASIAKNLANHLKVFRVRKKIDIDVVQDEYKLWTLYDDEGAEVAYSEPTLDGIHVFKDPRLKNMGLRVISRENVDVADIVKLFPDFAVAVEPNTDHYIDFRYKLGVGEGVVNIPPGKSFPLECNCDYMHGVSFHKGCYIGQELTARTHHTGVVRKRLMPLALTSQVQKDIGEVEIMSETDKNCGKLRGVGEKYGLGLIRIEPALQAKYLLVNKDVRCMTMKPDWWPKEARTL